VGSGLVKIVVTDDHGRYVLPDLPKANYRVWVRGYGLVDSAKILTEPGKILDLKAMPAPDPGDWLEAIGLGQYGDAFEANDIGVPNPSVNQP
jgi:hypothetical protein